MSGPDRADLRNQLLLRLAPVSFAALGPHLEAVDLPRGSTLCRQGEVISEVYFLEDGLASMILSAPDGREVETGVIGPEGCTPVVVALGADRTFWRTEMQVAGRGYRVGASSLRRTLDADGQARLLLTRFAHTLMVQVASTALFNATATVEQRLARWLLMAHDRLGDDDLTLTHDYLAVMLAVRRASVTTALHGLEGYGLVQSRRGFVTITDRPGLERMAGATYGAPEAEYRRLLGEEL